MIKAWPTILLLASASALPLAAQSTRPDTLASQVLWVSRQDSAITVAAGLDDGVGPQTVGIVYLRFEYLGRPQLNRIARCVLQTAADSICTLKVVASTAPVRPGYEIMLFGLARPAPPEVAARPEPSDRPFYRKKWFWIAGGAAAAAVIAAVAAGGGGSSSTGTVTVSGSLP